MDMELAYTEQGFGEPLVLLHGNGENRDYFTHQITRFSKTHRVLAVDTRGHGESPRGDAPFTIRQFARDLYEFLEQHTIPQADLLGFSDGGNIAMVFALVYPERVRRLILNGANLYGSGIKARIQLPIVLGYWLASLFAKKDPKARHNAELLGLMVNDPNLSPQELRKISHPTLVITGTNDMVKDKHSQLISESLPNAQWIRIPGDHFVANKNPEAFNEAVEHFLTGAQTGSGAGVPDDKEY